MTSYRAFALGSLGRATVLPYLGGVVRALGWMLAAFVQTLVRRIARGRPRPSWSFGFQLVLRYMRLDWEATADWDLARLRQEMDGRPYPNPHVKRVTSRDEVIGGVPTRIYGPREKKRDGAILFLHGGSCVYGSAKTTHADLLARIALESGAEVYGVDYRLAPEHPYPAQLEDALSVFDALVARGLDPSHIVLAGDSAGGNVAVAAQIALRDRPSAGAKALALLSPWVDLEMKGASFADDSLDFGNRAVLVRHAAAFAGAVPLDDPRVSPIRAQLSGLPETFVSWGKCEIPRDDIVSFVDALRAAGVSVTTHAAEDMPHNPAFFADFNPNGRASVDALLAFLAARLPPHRG